MVHNISLRTSAQATEDEERVKRSLALFLPPSIRIERTIAEGHFGNLITVLEARIEQDKDCKFFIDFLKSSLVEDELARIGREIPERVDEGCFLHIRLDKQAAYQGEVRLASSSDAIAVRIKIKAFPARKEMAVESAVKLLG